MEKDLECDLSSAELDSRDKLNVEIEHEDERVRERKKEKFKCHMCGSEFRDGYNLVNHTRTHTDERPFQCKFSDCGMAFKTESALIKHINHKHSSERPFQCDYPACLLTFKTSSNLNQHKKLHCDERPFTCTHSECNYRAKTKESLSQHAANIHTESKTLTCSKCKYSTNYASHLSRHLIVHEGKIEKIPCSIDGCKYKGKNSVALKEHMRRHKTLLSCPVSRCGRYLPTKEALMEHVKIHNSTGRAFQCPLCFKHYPALKHLQSHCVIHTNEKPFQCGHCELEAVRRNDVKVHISSVHAVTEFPFIIHLLDQRECLCCKVTLPSAEFIEHCKGHVSHSVTK